MSQLSEPEPDTSSDDGSVREMMPTVTRPLHVSVGHSAARSQQTLADAPPITPHRIRITRQSRWRRRMVMLILLAATGTAMAMYWQPIKTTVLRYVGPKTTDVLANIQTYTVKRGELRITIVEEGKLRAVNNALIRVNVQGKITFLAEAGSMVKKDDKLVVIDTKQYEDRLVIMQTDLQNFQRQLETANKELPIAKATGEAAISNAMNSQSIAELALKQYTTIEVPKKLNELDNLINDSRTKWSDQVKKRLDAQSAVDAMLNEGPDKDKLVADLRTNKQTEISLQRAVENAESQRKLFRSNNYAQDLKTKQRTVENSKVDVQKAKVSADNIYAQKVTEVTRLQNNLRSMETQIKSYEDTIARGTARAPIDGLVFYGSPDMARQGVSPDQIKVGNDWYSGSTPIMTIPDLSSFLVDVPIAEVYRGRVQIGMPVTASIDAVPGLVLEGKLTSVASVSRPKYQQDLTSPPVYDATVALALADPRMVAGMTVRVEIATNTLKDVLYVPVEAVFNEEGKTAAFMWIEDPNGGHVEKRPVFAGQSSDHFVELKKGVIEADRLLLSRPASFVTPNDYREQVDAMFPAAAPTTYVARAPQTLPADAMPEPARGRGRAAPAAPRPTTQTNQVAASPRSGAATRPSTAPDGIR